MAQGDPIIVNTGVGGGSQASISVPTGEVWAVSAYSNSYRGRLESDQADSDWIMMEQSRTNTGSGDQVTGAAQRPYFDENINPQYENKSCNTEDFYISAREI